MASYVLAYLRDFFTSAGQVTSAVTPGRTLPCICNSAKGQAFKVVGFVLEGVYYNFTLLPYSLTHEATLEQV